MRWHFCTIAIGSIWQICPVPEVAGFVPTVQAQLGPSNAYPCEAGATIEQCHSDSPFAQRFSPNLSSPISYKAPPLLAQCILIYGEHLAIQQDFFNIIGH